MILNNYWAWKEACDRSVISDSGSETTSMIDLDGIRVTTFATIYGNRNWGQSYEACSNECFRTHLSHRLSNENTPISENDYTINNLTGFRNQTTSCICTLVDGKLNYTFTCGGVNNNTSEQIITRIGITKSLIQANMSWQAVLMAIVELSEPITVPPGSGYSIVIEMIEE